MPEKPSDLIIARLLLLHQATHPTPRVVHENGMALVVCGEHTVQFDRDAGALFYAAAHQDVPALCVRVVELEGQIDSGELERVRAERDAAALMATKAQARVADLEMQLADEVKRRTESDAATRESLRFRAGMVELAKKVRALEAALEAERAPDRK